MNNMKNVFFLLILTFSLNVTAGNACKDYCSDYAGKAKGACTAGCSMGCQNSTANSNDTACSQIEASFEAATGEPAPWLDDMINGIGDFCGGIAGIQCNPGLICVDDPNDNCNPQLGGADCGGICIDESQGMVCTYDGTVYYPGDSFPDSDNCNTCYCSEDGLIACTKIACIE